jgi:hypothetical protein
MDDHSHDDLSDPSNPSNPSNSTTDWFDNMVNTQNTLTPSGPPLLSPLSLASLSETNEGAHGSNDEFDNEDDDFGNDDAIEDYYGNDYEDEDSDDIITIHDLVNPGNTQTEQNSSGTACEWHWKISPPNELASWPCFSDMQTTVSHLSFLSLFTTLVPPSALFTINTRLVVTTSGDTGY